MLRRVENAEVFYQRDVWGMLTGKYKIMLQVGNKQHFTRHRVTPQEFRQMEARSAAEPVKYVTVGERHYWRFEGTWHRENEGLDGDTIHALLVKRKLKQEDEIKRAKSIRAHGQLPDGSLRTRIPDDVRLLVFQRDGTQCVKCGNGNELQLDHIIPVSMGGGNTAENLEVLCGPCNRRKGASIA